MDHRRPYSFLTFVPVSAVLCVIGWGGIAFVLLNTLPTLGPRWLFFFFLVIAISGVTIPVVYFINLRFPCIPPVEAAVIIRQSLWVGVYCSILTWLQLGRVLNLVLALLLAGGLILIEALIRLRERSRWKP